MVTNVPIKPRDGAPSPISPHEDVKLKLVQGMLGGVHLGVPADLVSGFHDLLKLHVRVDSDTQEEADLE